MRVSSGHDAWREEGQQLLSTTEATSFRSSTMRLAFVADIPVFALGHSRWIQTFPAQDEARQDKTRKSVSCVVIMIGKHCLRVQVATQTAPALSPGEAEFAAHVNGSISWNGYMHAWHETREEKSRLGSTQTLMRDKGLQAASASVKIRHLGYGLLWIQHRVGRNSQIHKLAGPENKADNGTKP